MADKKYRAQNIVSVCRRREQTKKIKQRSNEVNMSRTIYYSRIEASARAENIFRRLQTPDGQKFTDLISLSNNGSVYHECVTRDGNLSRSRFGDIASLVQTESSLYREFVRRLESGRLLIYTNDEHLKILREILPQDKYDLKVVY